MKLNILVGLFVILAPFLCISQTYTQYFDGADTTWSSLIIEIDTSAANVWQIGPPQKNIFNSASTLPNALVTDTVSGYPDNNVSSFCFNIDPEWFDWGILALQWTQKLDMDLRNDGGIIEFWSNVDDTWQNAFDNPYVYNFYGFDEANQDTILNGANAFTGTDTTWKDIWLCFETSWLSYEDTLKFRFTMMSDSIDNHKEGWMIDNMLAHLTIQHTVNEEKQDEYMKVGPNPTTGRVEINTRKIEEFHVIEKIELINVEGKVVQEWGVSPTKFYIDIADHPNGIYILQIKTNIQSETFKIVLDR